MLSIGDAGNLPGFIAIAGAGEVRFTVAAAVDQSSFVPAKALIQAWMTDPVRQGGDTLLLPCTSVPLRYGAPCRMPRPAPPMH